MRCYVLWVAMYSYTCLRRTVNNPPATTLMRLSIFDSCCIIGDNALGDNCARGCGAWWIVRVSARALCLYTQPAQACNPVCRESPHMYRQYKSCVREKGSWNWLRPLACAAICRLASTLLRWV